MHNLKELNGNIKHIGDFCGYEVYIPSSYNNPISYLNKNCPIWIKINEEEVCHVIFLNKNSREENEKEIRDYILNNLPSKSYVYCTNIQHSDIHPLSCVAIDGSEEICAEIIVKECNNLLVIDSVKYKDKKALLKLRQHLMSENNIQTYPAVILYFNSETISLYTIELLGATYNESRDADILQLF